MSISDFFGQVATRIISNVLYFSGLTALMLFFIARKAPDAVIFWSGTPNALLALAVLFTAMGFIGIFLTSMDLRTTYLRISLVTLVPGLLSLIITLFGQGYIVGQVEHLPAFEQILPFIETYIKNTVPKLWILTVSYLGVSFGFLFLWHRAA